MCFDLRSGTPAKCDRREVLVHTCTDRNSVDMRQCVDAGFEQAGDAAKAAAVKAAHHDGHLGISCPVRRSCQLTGSSGIQQSNNACAVLHQTTSVLMKMLCNSDSA